MVERFDFRTVRKSVSQKRLTSGLAVYGALTSFIFKTIIAVMKMQITLMTVKRPDTMPLIKNSVGK